MTKYLLLILLVGGAFLIVGRWRHQPAWFKFGIALLGLGVVLLVGFVALVMLSPNV